MLEAGRRAEIDGKHDYAVQFYSYVVTHHGGSPEAGEAADALRRLAILEPDNRGMGPQNQAQPANAAGPPQYAPLNPQNGGGYVQTSLYGVPVTAPPGRAQLPAGHASAPQFQALPSNGQRRTKSEPGLTTGPHAKTRRRQKTRDTAGSAPAKTYRLGRVMAAMLGFLGWIGIIAGLVELGSGLVLSVTKSPNALLPMLAASPTVAISLFAASCVAILLSQMAWATFDAAARGPATYDDEEDEG